MTNSSNYYTVCFTGHRTLERNERTEVQEKLDRTVRYLTENRGAVIFRAGGALGFDTMAALSVLRCRELYPHIRLELYFPCPEQAHGWHQADIDIYNDIKRRADRIYVACPTYAPGCMHLRNRLLVDGSDICIAYCKRSTGGSAYTLDYAKRCYLATCNLAHESLVP